MDQAATERARNALGDPRLRALDPAGVDLLAEELVRDDRAADLAVVRPHGGTACFLPTGHAGPKRRFLEFDRYGALIAALHWEGSGSLASAVVRTSHGDWIGVKARAAWHGIWGPSDRLWRLPDGPGWEPGEPLTVRRARDWASSDDV